MSTLTIKVCEECGRQSVSGDGWLVMSSFDIKSAKTNESLVHTETGVDICSQGCLLRYVAKTLEPAISHRLLPYRKIDQSDVSGQSEIIAA